MFYYILFISCAIILFCIIALSPRIPTFNFAGKLVVVTGGSSGIGKEVVKILLHKGAYVAIVARDNIKLENTVQEFSAHKDNLLAVSADVTSSDEIVHAAFELACQHFGRRIDALVCCAGISVAKLFHNTDRSEFEKVMNINFSGSVNCVRQVLPGMRQMHCGRICLISSQAGNLGLIGYTAYCASKFALRGFAEALQMETRPYGIIVSISHPPDTDTPQLAAENISKPQVLKEIAGASGVWEASTVADGIVSQMESGAFLGYFGFNGFALASISAGVSPIHSKLQFFLQIAMASILRFAALFINFDFDRTIKKYEKSSI